MNSAAVDFSPANTTYFYLAFTYVVDLTYMEPLAWAMSVGLMPLFGVTQVNLINRDSR